MESDPELYCSVCGKRVISYNSTDVLPNPNNQIYEFTPGSTNVKNSWHVDCFLKDVNIPIKEKIRLIDEGMFKNADTILVESIKFMEL